MKIQLKHHSNVQPAGLLSLSENTIFNRICCRFSHFRCSCLTLSNGFAMAINCDVYENAFPLCCWISERHDFTHDSTYRVQILCHLFSFRSIFHLAHVRIHCSLLFTLYSLNEYLVVAFLFHLAVFILVCVKCLTLLSFNSNFDDLSIGRNIQ